MSARTRRVAVALALGTLALAGCGHRLEGVAVPNRAPVMRITEGEVLGTNGGPDLSPYTVSFRWTGFDPDGAIDHYAYATSPTDTSLDRRDRWNITRLGSVRLRYRADSAYAALDDSSRRRFTFTRAQGFFVRAVDDAGAMSPWESRMFTAFDIAPTSVIRSPVSTNRPANVGPSTVLHWDGEDLDATSADKRPARYHLFVRDITPPPPALFQRDVDAMARLTLLTRGFYVGGDTTSWAMILEVGHTYCAIVKAVDEAGAEEPLPTLERDKTGEVRILQANAARLGVNMSIFTVQASTAKPNLTVRAGSATRSFLGYDPNQALSVQVPAGAGFLVSWSASAADYGGQVLGYSYALDIDDPAADRPVVTQPGGFGWGPLDPRATIFVFPGSTPPGVHRLFIKTLDEAGSTTIAAVQVEVVAPKFDRAVLYILDSPDMTSGFGVTSVMTVEENVAFWKDILETGRTFLDTREDPAGRCRPVAGADSFIVNRPNSIRNIPFSVLGRYRVIVWYVPQGRVLAPTDYILHQYAASGGYNNLVAYLQSGGHVWGFGGGFAKALETIGSPSYPINPGRESTIGSLLYDFLGIRGTCTVFPTQNNSVNPRSFPEKDPRLESIEPHPLPFSRATALGRESSRIPSLSFDVGRYDTLPATRYDPANQGVPFTSANECLDGLPQSYLPAAPDSSAWQPIAVYRPKGPQATASMVGLSPPVPLDGAVVGWYHRASTLASTAGGLAAPFQLYFFGVDLALMHREEVRRLADVLLSTKGWDIYPGGCPAKPARK